MNELIETEEKRIESMIYEIRGQQVMLDSDLAKLYECMNGTKEVNQAVKNNPDKFPERFSWKLDKEEYNYLRSKFSTTKLEEQGRGGRRYNPRVFTEQGVAMLATILKSPVATRVSIAIMDAFVMMRKYISNNLLEQNYINNMVLEHDKNIKLLQNSFSKFEEKRKNNEIYFNGQIWDAYSKIQEIFKETKEKLVIIDNYADNTILDMIKKLKVEVILITKPKNLLTEQDIERYNSQYHNLKVYFNDSFHDRYFILDDKETYHCGTSINRIGYRTFSMTLISDIEVRNALQNKLNEIV